MSEDAASCYVIGGWTLLFPDTKLVIQLSCCIPALESFRVDTCNSHDISITASHTLNIPDDIHTYPASKLLDQYSYGSIFRKIYDCFEHKFLYVIQDLKKSFHLTALVSSSWNQVSMNSFPTPTGLQYLSSTLGNIYFNYAISRNGLVFHAALMEFNDLGVLLSGPSGIGKSTHAHLWRDAGHATIINGDNALCRQMDGIWTGFGMPWCGSSGESENRQVPIMAIVVLEQSETNSVRRLDPLDALTHLLPNILAPKWEPTLYNKALDRLDEIIPEIPIYLLRCRPDIDAMLTLKREMDRLLDQGGKA